MLWTWACRQEKDLNSNINHELHLIFTTQTLYDFWGNLHAHHRLILCFCEAGKAAASIAGRVMGQNAAVAGDDPEQATKWEMGWRDELWSWKLHKSIQIFTFRLGTYMSPVGGRSCSECRPVCCEDFNPCWVWVAPTQLLLAVGLVHQLDMLNSNWKNLRCLRCGLRSSGLSDEQMAEVAVTAAGHAAGHPKDVGKTDCWAVADELHRGWQCCNCCGGSSRVCCLCGWPGQSTQNSGWPGLPGGGMTWETRKKNIESLQ